VRPTPVQLQITAKRLTIGAWFDPRRSEELKDAIAMLETHNVVLLGETHNEPDDHRWQLHTIETLFSLRPEMVLGFEMFPRRVQPVLDRWSRGELNETAFLDEVDWPRIWGFDPTGRTSVILRRPLQAIENACSDGSRTTRLAVKARPRIRQGSRVSFGLSCSGIAPWRKPLPEHVAIDRARSLSASWAEDI